MNILVTGGAGFIGSHIVNTYIEAGHCVTVIDNLSSGKLQFLNPKAKFYKMDILDPKITEVLKSEKMADSMFDWSGYPIKVAIGLALFAVIFFMSE